MSFSLYIAKKPADAAIEEVTASSAPASIKDFINAAIVGLVAKFGDDVRVDVSASGHLCDGKDSYSPSNASITVDAIL